MRNVEVKIGDITKEKVDAIVNAANREMIGGGGVDGAIHRAAGPQLRVECEKFPADAHGRRIQTGEAKITIGCKLPAKFVIHTAGPDCARVHDPDEQDRLLAASWRNSLAIVAERGLKSVAFPSISTGIYGFPKERAAKIAAVEVAKFLVDHPDVEVRICLLGHDAKRTKAIYEQAFAASMPITFRPCCEGQKSDIGFVDMASLDLAFIMQRVNRQLSMGRDPKPGETAYRRFKDIDYGRLCELGNRDPDGLAAFSKYVYDEVLKSEASGWREWIVKPYWRPELYDKHNPQQSTCLAEWSFRSSLAIANGIVAKGSLPHIAVPKQGQFPDELSYDVLAGVFRQTENGSTCPRHGYIDGVHYIAKCEMFQVVAHRQKTTSRAHVHNEFVADGVIRGMGFCVPASREYSRCIENSNLVRLARFVEPTIPLNCYYSRGETTDEERANVRRQVIAAYPLQHMIAGFDTFQNDNVLVTEDGNLWFVDNGASFGWSAMGAYDKYYKYNERKDPNNKKYGFLSLRNHPSQMLLQSILSGVADAELWAAAAKFDVDRFVSLLPNDIYDVSSIRAYAETVVAEAKKHLGVI